MRIRWLMPKTQEKEIKSILVQPWIEYNTFDTDGIAADTFVVAYFGVLYYVMKFNQTPDTERLKLPSVRRPGVKKELEKGHKVDQLLSLKILFEM